MRHEQFKPVQEKLVDRIKKVFAWLGLVDNRHPEQRDRLDDAHVEDIKNVMGIAAVRYPGGGTTYVNKGRDGKMGVISIVSGPDPHWATVNMGYTSSGEVTSQIQVPRGRQFPPVPQGKME